MFNLNKKHSIQYHESSFLSGCDFLTHAFCTRLGGVSEEDYKSLNISFKEGDLESMVLQNWYRLAMASGFLWPGKTGGEVQRGHFLMCMVRNFGW